MLLVNTNKEEAYEVSFYSMLKWVSGSRGADSALPAASSLKYGRIRVND